MLNRIKFWLWRRRQLSEAVQYDNGYEFASAILIRFMGAVDPCDQIVEEDLSPFDFGIRAAVVDFEQLTRMPVRVMGTP